MILLKTDWSEYSNRNYIEWDDNLIDKEFKYKLWLEYTKALARVAPNPHLARRLERGDFLDIAEATPAENRCGSMIKDFLNVRSPFGRVIGVVYFRKQVKFTIEVYDVWKHVAIDLYSGDMDCPEVLEKRTACECHKGDEHHVEWNVGGSSMDGSGGVDYNYKFCKRCYKATNQSYKPSAIITEVKRTWLSKIKWW